MLFKRKKKVDINAAPLESVTVGQIKQNKFGFIKLIVLFSLFGGIIFYLPELQKLYQLYFGSSTPSASSSNVNNTNTNNTNNNTANNTSNNINNVVNPPNEDEVKKYLFNTDDKVLIDDYQFDNIKYKDKVLSFDVTNLTEKTLSLRESNVYFIVYFSNTLVHYIGLNKTIEPSKKVSFTFNIDTIVDTYTIEEIPESTYPSVKLTDNKLTCEKANEKIQYTFDSNKLVSIAHTYIYASSNADYQDVYSKYLNYLFDYNTETGIKVLVSDNNEGFTYTMNINYAEYTGKIDYPLYYAKGTFAKNIKFLLESQFFNCK